MLISVTGPGRSGDDVDLVLGLEGAVGLEVLRYCPPRWNAARGRARPEPGPPPTGGAGIAHHARVRPFHSVGFLSWSAVPGTVAGRSGTASVGGMAVARAGGTRDIEPRRDRCIEVREHRCWSVEDCVRRSWVFPVPGTRDMELRAGRDRCIAVPGTGIGNGDVRRRSARGLQVEAMRRTKSLGEVVDQRDTTVDGMTITVRKVEVVKPPRITSPTGAQKAARPSGAPKTLRQEVAERPSATGRARSSSLSSKSAADGAVRRERSPRHVAGPGGAESVDVVAPGRWRC